jgi:hypothetical protein
MSTCLIAVRKSSPASIADGMMTAVASALRAQIQSRRLGQVLQVQGIFSDFDGCSAKRDVVLC